jgi:hypothetical protein
LGLGALVLVTDAAANSYANFIGSPQRVGCQKSGTYVSSGFTRPVRTR